MTQEIRSNSSERRPQLTPIDAMCLSIIQPLHLTLDSLVVFTISLEARA